MRCGVVPCNRPPGKQSARSEAEDFRLKAEGKKQSATAAGSGGGSLAVCRNVQSGASPDAKRPTPARCRAQPGGVSVFDGKTARPTA